MDAALPNSACYPEGLRLQFFCGFCARVCVCVCVCVWGFMAPATPVLAPPNFTRLNPAYANYTIGPKVVPFWDYLIGF